MLQPFELYKTDKCPLRKWTPGCVFNFLGLRWLRPSLIFCILGKPQFRWYAIIVHMQLEFRLIDQSVSSVERFVEEPWLDYTRCICLILFRVYEHAFCVPVVSLSNSIDDSVSPEHPEIQSTVTRFKQLKCDNNSLQSLTSLNVLSCLLRALNAATAYTRWKGGTTLRNGHSKLELYLISTALLVFGCGQIVEQQCRSRIGP